VTDKEDREAITFEPA